MCFLQMLPVGRIEYFFKVCLGRFLEALYKVTKKLGFPQEGIRPQFPG